MKKLLFWISVEQFVSLVLESQDLSIFLCSGKLVSVSLFDRSHLQPLLCSGKLVSVSLFDRSDLQPLD
jgi:hypothetical protein